MSPVEDKQEEQEDPAVVLRELLEEIVDSIGLDVDVRVERSDGTLTGCVEGEDVGLFIGRHGQTIDAIQHLAQRIVFRGGSPDARVVIDADGYRERRAGTLRSIALEAAEGAVRSGEAVALDPMPASERRIVHEYLRERGDVETHSEGEEPGRYLVVEPAEA
ncbi:MAG TPA: R3H domain-containing nucleic acid-binding protein [Solirubrobacteraceae bacterium]|jgi:spoIIIJ-associated protein|nr:R3H domain-containing nucleic acid-binding protein [Solirubrobacteraceae bacterium]